MSLCFPQPPNKQNTLTIVEVVEQGGRVDVRAPDQDVVDGPLGSLQAGAGQARGDGEGLPPAQAGGVGERTLGQDDVVPPHGHVLEVVHLVQQRPRHACGSNKETLILVNVGLKPISSIWL